MDKLYIVIVTYNGMQWIDQCLESLYQSSIDSKVVIVDNNSKDNTVDHVNKHFPDVTILQQNENLGFGKANNLGISHALKNNADFVFLLNQDAFVEKKSLEKLIELSKGNAQYGVLSPFHLTWEGNSLEYYFSKFILKNLKIYSDYVLRNDIESLYEIPFINAAAWLIPSKIFKTVGGFDPIFYHYGEDNNFCQRVHFHNYKIGVVPEATIYHDSKKRKLQEKFLFSEVYFSNEIKQYQIKFADINRNVSEKDFRRELSYIKKLIVLNAIRLDLSAVRGYIEKFKILKKNINLIMQSRGQNKLENSHYLNF